MAFRKIRLMFIAGLLCAPGALFAQESGQIAAQGSGQGQDQAPASVEPSPSETERSQAELRQAYEKEYAFLEAQQRDLKKQLAQAQSDFNDEQQSLNADIRGLEKDVVRLGNRSDELQDLVTEAERQAQTNAEAREMLQTTFSQAGSTLEQYGRDPTGQDSFSSATDPQKVSMLFDAGLKLVSDLSRVRAQPGDFFLTDGTQVQGRIIHVGNIASFGVSNAGAGALAPAGEGKLKVWPDSSPAEARALANGQSPDTLHGFLYESTSKSVEEDTGEGLVAYISDGGVIAWIIVGIGLLAVLLIVARALFLKRASASTEPLQQQVGTLVSQGRRDDALEACKRQNGATARVMAAAVRNLDRDREHVEDIVSEAILHENAHLNRFGAFILVLAAVSPLLGLLGTVTGMISTFDVITKFGTGDPKLLSSGISIALITTELGLIVAIPTLLIGNLLSGWAERIKETMEQAALKIINQYQEIRYRENREAA